MPVGDSITGGKYTTGGYRRPFYQLLKANGYSVTFVGKEDNGEPPTIPGSLWWTLTPLPVAFSDDPQVYDRDNAITHGYEWMIGDALLAAPLYGNDYATATTRDIYLPAGQWMDFDTGQIYPGHQVLKHFSLPPDKTPLFVGGSGVTLEDRNGTLKICIYPVAQEGTTHVTLPDDTHAITVKVQGLPPGHAWESVLVTDSGKHRIAVATDAHSVSFLPTPGETYTVRAEQSR